ncbi:MAG TPA: phage tail length tape measure family protein, partial [Kaistia sp.]|nr:phage tail length tape measure family protein [Kaistia sp.]
RLAELAGAAEDATRDLLGLNRRTAEAARGAAELEQRFASAARAARGFQQQAEQLDRALRTGTIGQNQYYATLARARTAYEAAAAGARQFGAANENAARQAEASQNRIVTLGGAARQAAESIGSTIEPFTDLLGKGQQIAEAIGGIRRATAGLPPSVVRIGVGVGTVAAGATLLFDAVESYRASVRQVTIANAAMGNTAGLSGNRLETMARSMADAAGISRPAAREMQANLLMTGRIGGQAMERIIALSRDYGTAIGKDAVIAAAELGEALADPAQGAEKLTRRFNLLTDAQLQNVRALAAQGQHAKAQLVVLDAAAQRFGGLSKNVGILEGALHSVGTASSNAWDSLGSGILLALGTGSLDDRIAQDRSRIAAIEKKAGDRATGDLSSFGDPAARGLRDAEFANRNLTPAGGLLPTEAAKLATLRQKVDEDLEIRRSLGWAEVRHQREAPLRAAGDAARSLARTIDPLHGRRAELQAQEAILQAGVASGTLGNGDHVRQQLERVTNARTTLRTETEKAVELAKVETAAATMLGLERDRYLARARTEIELSGQLLTGKERKERLDAAEALATAAHTQALTQLTHQLDLQATAQERLAEAAGQGEAAMRQAAI